MWDLILLATDHCLFFFCLYLKRNFKNDTLTVGFLPVREI